MLVLLISKAEAEGLLNQRPSLSQGLKEYVMRELRQETLLPDDNLPQSIVLEQVEGSERGYQAIIRTFADQASADQACGEGRV